MKKLSTLLAAVAVAAAVNTTSAEVWAVPGTFQGWHPENAECTPGENGTFVLQVADFYGDFKVVRYDNPGQANWDNQWCSNGSTIEEGVPYTANKIDNGSNIVLAGENVHVKNATITITPSTTDDSIVILIKGEAQAGQEEWFLVGDAPLQWDFSVCPKFTKGDNGVWTLPYTGTIDTQTFKVVKNSAWSNSYSTKGAISLNQTYTLDGPADPLDNMSAADGPWENPVFTLTVGDNITLKVSTDNAGIDAVAADTANGPVVYYNLQGQRVDNPANGLYIRVQGDKAVKVAL